MIRDEKINVIDLFAGCGGLLEGFMREGSYYPVASVEWEKAPLDNLKHRLKTKWGIENAEEKCLLMDMQNDETLFSGWNGDEKYGNGVGLDYLVKKQSIIDIVIGGPPCQAYSVAGRIRDKDAMKFDYRNYLFENYLKVVNKYRPKLFVFENVPGMLSSKPGGNLVTDLIRKEIDAIDYEIIDGLKKYALLDLSEFDVPQSRKRVIIIGVDKRQYHDTNIQRMLINFYTNILSKYKVKEKKTLWDAIGYLPPCLPNKNCDDNKRKDSHIIPDPPKVNGIVIKNHVPRYHNKRDMKIFRLLAEDIESGKNKYTSSDELNKMYEKTTGKATKVHKYHVLRKNQPSTTILAHLYKDGLRFIHPDPNQERSITVREAAEIQTFPKDYEFISSQGANYKMIGNAVPPEFSYRLSKALKEIL